MPFNKVVIIGVGLIGGSFAAALRRTGQAQRIVGVGRSQRNMEHALARQIIDEIASDIASAVHNADLIFLAMPVGQTDDVMMRLAPHVQANTIITDAGSTKQDVIAAARAHLSLQNRHHFVPGHPIAGAEHSGVQAARADLYQNRHVILTPLPETSLESVEHIRQLWQACGAQVSLMAADEHDRVLATTSHLPHVLAFTLMNHLKHGNHAADDLLRFAGSGFRDFTRIASSSPEMWRDICLANRDALLTQIEAYQAELHALAEILRNNDDEALERAFSQARALREDWLKRTNKTSES
ncbi:prephenate dehydrogenase/arogenate dehydrogenase family protein [Nitrosomonas sp. JL21]|uniref:prephenate dehydrogenase n=1 Tax=Nitrosomonas sp. JL21 TaxID=153949 RepID=UPI00136EC7AE|nr:prephenate dehydrogenase/arogenate dehydrogenase family protein [Nitrosomonas sp. JL21]MBL8498317.1 prephenate dehydrogenase/arogenate dehydrogenase family protein [Nitrosomonas sp.]MCC7090976.1 prephenate dehydrogenase/arogenate dehydrogenase family protein [Nitrosomonas sp.]MXS77534.1 prephenate dehydrogenase/arogenate dehydrogenase family protein [Nitrosomonas sp. JL21]